MKRRILSFILVFAMCLSILPTRAWAAQDGVEPDDTPVGPFSTESDLNIPEAGVEDSNADGVGTDKPEETDGFTVPAQEENTESAGAETEDDAQEESDDMPGFDLPVIESTPDEESADSETEIMPTAINPDLPDAEKVKGYFGNLSGVYAAKRDVADRDDIDWSVFIAEDGEISLLYQGNDTGATVTALNTVNAATGAPAGVVFSNPDKWFNGTAANAAAATLTVTWNAANRYFTMANNAKIYWDVDDDGAREYFYFSSTPKMYNEAQIASFFAAYAGSYPLNDGSGWSVEIGGSGGVSLLDSAGAAARAVIESATFDTSDPSVVKTVIFYSPDWFDAKGTGAQTLTLTWNSAFTWNSNSFSRNEFSVPAVTLYTAAGSSDQPWKVFTTSHFFTGKNWSNEYLKAYAGAYVSGAGNDVTDGWKLVIGGDGYVTLTDTAGEIAENPARLNAVTGATINNAAIPRVNTMTVAIPGWYANTSYNTPGIITLTWQADSVSGNGVGRFTTAAVTLHRPGDGGQDETLYIPILYFDHETLYTAEAKKLLRPYAGKYMLDDGSGWYVDIDGDGSAMLYDGNGNVYRPYYYTLTNPLSDARSLSSVVFRDAEWYNNTGATGYQTLTLVWCATISSSSTYARPAFISNASNGAALTTVLYNADATVQKNFNGARFTSRSWANDYFTGNAASSGADSVSYAGAYNVGAGYGEQYPQVTDWKLEIDSDGYVWLKNDGGKVCDTPATLTAVASTARTAASNTPIPRVSTMVIAVPGYYTNASTKQQGYLTLTWAADNTAGASYQGNGIYRFTTGAATLYNEAGSAVYFPAMYFDHSENYTAAAKGLLKNYAGEYLINDASGWRITVDSEGSVTLTDSENETRSPCYYTLTNPLNNETRTLASVTFGDADWFTNTGTAPQTLTLAWTPATRRFTGPSTILYKSDTTILKSFTSSVIFSGSQNIEAAKNYLKAHKGEYIFNDDSGNTVRINDDGGISIKLPGITAGNGFVDVNFMPTLANYSYAGSSGGQYVSSLLIPVPGWYASSAANTPAYLTLTFWNDNAAAVLNHTITIAGTTFYKTASESKTLSAGTFYLKEEFDAAAEYLADYAGDYLFNDGSGSAVRIDGGGGISIKLPGITAGNDYVPVNFTPTLANYSYAGNSGGRYVSSVQISIPDWYANASVNSRAYLTLTWNGNAANIVNHYFSVNNTVFYKTATEYRVLSAGRFYSEDDRALAAAYLKQYAGEYHPRVSGDWYAVIDGNGYVTVHTRGANGADVAVAPALNINATDANGKVTSVNQVLAILPAYAGSRTNQDVANIKAAPQVTFSFTPNANSPYFAASGGVTLYDRAKADGSAWGVAASSSPDYYKTFSGKLYTGDRAYSNKNKENAKAYFKRYKGAYVVDDGSSAYKIIISDDGEIFWSKYAAENTKDLLPADVNFNASDEPSGVYVWYNGYYSAATAAQAGEPGNYTFTPRGELGWVTAAGDVQYSFASANTTIYEEGGASIVLPSNQYHYLLAMAEPSKSFMDGRYYAEEDAADDGVIHFIDIATNGDGRTYLFDGEYPLTLFGENDERAYLRGVLGTTTANGTKLVFGVFLRADEAELDFRSESDTTYWIGDKQFTIGADAAFTQNNSASDGAIVVVNPNDDDAGTRYHYLAQAVANVEKGGVIYLTEDVELRVTAGSFGGKEFTIDGKTRYPGTGEMATIRRGTVAGAPYTDTFLKIGPSSNVTLKDVIIDAGGDWQFIGQTEMDKEIERSLNNETISQSPITVGTNNIEATGSLIELRNGKLTLEGARITNFYTTSSSYQVFDFSSGVSYGELIISGGELSHNAGVNHLFANNTTRATIKLADTVVSENYTSNGNGGLFCVAGGSVLYLNDGVKITDNVAVNSCGTVADVVGRVDLLEADRASTEKERIYIDPPNGVNKEQECSYVYINGAEITGNTGLNSGGQPFYIEPVGGLTMDGGKITGNTGAYCGAIWSNNNGVTLDIVIKGESEIHDNKTREDGYECVFCMVAYIHEGADVSGKIYVNDGRLFLSSELPAGSEIWIDGAYGGLTIEKTGVVNGDVHLVWHYMDGTVANNFKEDFIVNNGTLNGNVYVEDHTNAQNNGDIKGDVTVRSRGESSGADAFVNGSGGTLKGNVKVESGTSASNEGTIEAGNTGDSALSVASGGSFSNEGSIRGNIEVASGGAVSNEGAIDGDVKISSDGLISSSVSFDNGPGGTVDGSIEIGPGAVASNEGRITGGVTVKADGEFSITGDAVVEGDITVYPGAELRSNNSNEETGHPHVNGKITLEYEDEEDLRRMLEILEDSEIDYDEIEYVLHAHTATNYKEKPPTCTEDGVSYRECETCGRRYDEMVLKAVGHSFEKATIQVRDCTHDEIVVNRCSACGLEIPAATENFATGHEYQKRNSRPPTAEAEGYDVYECVNCAASYTVTIPQLSVTCAAGHSWNGGTVVAPAACTEDGTKRFTCTECGATKIEPIPAAGYHTADHKPVLYAAVDASCTAEGYADTIQHCAVCHEPIESTIAREMIMPTGHSWGQWKNGENRLCTDEGSRTRVCAACGAEETEINARAEAHTWDGNFCTKCPATRNGESRPATPGNPGGGGSSNSGPAAYPPTISDTKNGSVSVSPENPLRDDTVTITPTPDEGYAVGDVVVKDSDGGELAVKDNGDGTFSFRQPAGRVSIDVTFVFACDGGDDCPSRAFVDLNTGAWYHEATNYVIRHGLMNGYGSGVFGPDNTLSRAMLAQILYNLDGGIPVNYLMQYDDVPADAWYAEAVRWATSEGVVGGYGDGRFGSDDPITREQLAAMLWRYAGSRKENADISGFADADMISAWAADAVAWAVSNGIVRGRDNGLLDPRGNATRTEAAAMMMRFCQNIDRAKS